MIRSPEAPNETRRRILEAAGEVFAEAGFEGATVRQITERAGVNLAAINYHFGDKAELYAHLLTMCRTSGDVRPWPEAAPARERLRFFIERLVHRLMSPDCPKWRGLLFAREMSSPTPALDRMVREQIGPEQAQLHDTLGELTGRRLPARELALLGFGVVGQCVFYVQHGALVERVFPEMRTHPPAPQEIIDHVLRSTLAAIEARATAPQPSASGARPAA